MTIICVVYQMKILPKKEWKNLEKRGHFTLMKNFVKSWAWITTERVKK
jgi:hypothetical protein